MHLHVGQKTPLDAWEGHDEEDHAFGRGWAVLDGVELTGMIFFHQGDESGFAAQRVE